MSAKDDIIASLKDENAQLRAEVDALRAGNQAPTAGEPMSSSPSGLDVAGVLAALDRIVDRAKVNAVHASGGVLDLVEQLRERLATRQGGD